MAPAVKIVALHTSRDAAMSDPLHAAGTAQAIPELLAVHHAASRPYDSPVGGEASSMEIARMPSLRGGEPR